MRTPPRPRVSLRARFATGMRRLPRTLKAQLLVYGAVAVLLIVALTTSFIVRYAQARAQRQVEAQLLDTAAALAAAVQRADAARAREVLTAFHRSIGEGAGYRMEVIDTAGRVVAATNPAHVGLPIIEALSHPEPELQRVLSGELPAAFEQTSDAGEPVMDVSLPLYGDPADPRRITGALHLAVPERAVTSLTLQLLAAIGLSSVLVAVLLIVPLLLYLERSLLRPMRILITANQAVAEGRPEGRAIPAEAMPAHELGEVMRTRNEMLAQLDLAEGELRRRMRELSTLYSTAALLTESLSLDEVLGRTLDKILEITGRDAAELSLFDPATKRLVVRAYRGFSAEWLADEADRPTTCLCGQVAHQQEPLCLSDVVGNPHVTRPACAREGFRSFCAIPLQAEGQVLGVMSLHGRQAHEPSAQERDLLTTIGNQVAIALLNIRLYEETRRLAITDGLTGLINRRHFLDLAGHEFERFRRYNRPLSVIMLDIDNFKRVNDTHGHAVGDEVLQALAARFRANVRDIDLLARYGGEEFAVLLPESDPPGARQAAERLRRSVAETPIETAAGLLSVTISLGLALVAPDCPDLPTLLRLADDALYAAKAAGRNHVCWA